ncbi:uncharacterized protein VICG_00722 [Vittaforma corneae ATCC 50505]|uniref:Uncharacterized protein n=1 Tax=Vittaforma corneae (strain ATCC 50505) TaxID=993615 RepID=L2GPS2_VITCO|nr:uncharacterized protein VICG_00722 [Vittaforma corneae ATCC 50505]ELA42322.1 hypothetical protein VICG_00722 [Vittaforma corneae ATCC 50505]
MGYFEGIVPKYLILYSVIKILVDLNDFRKGIFKDFDRKFYYLEIAKFFVIASRIMGMKYIRRRAQFNLTIMSVFLETALFFYQSRYFSRFRLYLEAVFGCTSFIFLIFFHPSYCKRNANKNKDTNKDKVCDKCTDKGVKEGIQNKEKSE